MAEQTQTGMLGRRKYQAVRQRSRERTAGRLRSPRDPHDETARACISVLNYFLLVLMVLTTLRIFSALTVTRTQNAVTLRTGRFRTRDLDLCKQENARQTLHNSMNNAPLIQTLGLHKRAPRAARRPPLRCPPD